MYYIIITLRYSCYNIVCLNYGMCSGLVTTRQPVSVCFVSHGTRAMITCVLINFVCSLAAPPNELRAQGALKDADKNTQGTWQGLFVSFSILCRCTCYWLTDWLRLTAEWRQWFLCGAVFMTVWKCLMPLLLLIALRQRDRVAAAFCLIFLVNKLIKSSVCFVSNSRFKP